MSVYGFCDAKGKHEIYTKEECDENFCKKEELDERIAEATPILSGNTTPSNAIGEDGNVYLMYSE
jgi:hypothetical protein